MTGEERWPDGRLILHRDKDLTPLETLEWAHKFEDFDYRTMVSTDVGAITVLTAWIGVIDNMFGTALLARRNGGTSIRELETYETQEAAIAGHDRWVAAARNNDLP